MMQEWDPGQPKNNQSELATYLGSIEHKNREKHEPVIATLERHLLPKHSELRKSQISELENQVKEFFRYLEGKKRNKDEYL